MKYILFLTENL